jgi:hypothetical protein
MNMQSSWSTAERKQVLAVAAAPAVVVAVLGVALTLVWAQDATLLALFALPLAYGTLFLCVLPALAVLHRSGKESGATFVAVSSASGLLPWGLVYAASSGMHEQPPLSLGIWGALLQAVVTALVASLIWWRFFRAKNAASQETPSK